MEGITMDKEILINQFNDTQNRIKILENIYKTYLQNKKD